MSRRHHANRIEHGSAQVVALLALLLSLVAIILALVAIMSANRPPRTTIHETHPVGLAGITNPKPASTQPLSGPPYLAAAGRSPLPTPGEMRVEPIAPKRLDGQTLNPPLVPWEDAPGHVDQTIIAEGEVVGTNNIGDITFLNFHADWKDKLSVVVYQQVYDQVPGGKPEVYYLNKTIRVTGRVQLHRNRPQIQVRDAGQIEVVP